MTHKHTHYFRNFPLIIIPQRC